MMPWSALMEDACRFFERHLTDEHRRHLWTRYGLMPDFVEVMRIGYAPADGSALLLHLMDRGYSRDEIIGSGLVMPWQRTDEDGGTRSGVSDLFRGRIVFPYLDADLRPVYFIGRMTDETPARDARPRRSTRSSS
jgi:DNA primase